MTTTNGNTTMRPADLIPVEYEEDVVTGILKHGNRMLGELDKLQFKLDDLVTELPRWVYEQALDLRGNGEEITQPELFYRLEQIGRLNDLPVITRIESRPIELNGSLASARLVQDYAARRKKLKRAAKATQEALNPKARPNRRTNRRVTSADLLETLSNLGYSFRMSELTDKIEVNGDLMTDAQRAKIRTQLRDAGYARYLTAAEDAYHTEAHKNRYHPIKQYLDNLEYDGYPHIANLTAHFGDADNIFGRWFKAWVVGAVAKVYEAAQNYMLVLDGPQGIGKSHFAAWLGSPLPRFFIEAAINPDDKDNQIRLISNWIWEVAELGATFRRSDREALKFFITQRWVTVRAPFGRYDLHKPALASLIGTINNEAGFLTDPTGNRRFLVCELNSIHWGYTKIDVNQVWAEAVAEYRAGYDYRLRPQEQQKQHEINVRYTADSPVLEMFLKHFDYTTDPTDPRYELCLGTSEVITRLDAMGLRGSQKSNLMELSGALKALGISKGRKGGKRVFFGVWEKTFTEMPT